MTRNNRAFHATVERPHKVVGVEEPFSVELYDPPVCDARCEPDSRCNAGWPLVRE